MFRTHKTIAKLFLGDNTLPMNQLNASELLLNWYIQDVCKHTSESRFQTKAFATLEVLLSVQ